MRGACPEIEVKIVEKSLSFILDIVLRWHSRSIHCCFLKYSARQWVSSVLFEATRRRVRLLIKSTTNTTVRYSRQKSMPKNSLLFERSLLLLAFPFYWNVAATYGMCKYIQKPFKTIVDRIYIELKYDNIRKLWIIMNKVRLLNTYAKQNSNRISYNFKLNYRWITHHHWITIDHNVVIVIVANKYHGIN